MSHAPVPKPSDVDLCPFRQPAPGLHYCYYPRGHEGLHTFELPICPSCQEHGLHANGQQCLVALKLGIGRFKGRVESVLVRQATGGKVRR